MSLSYGAAVVRRGARRGRKAHRLQQNKKPVTRGGVEVAREVREADAAAGGSSTMAFDPCLDTGEVGEGPAVGEVEEPGVESPVDGGQGYT